MTSPLLNVPEYSVTPVAPGTQQFSTSYLFRIIDVDVGVNVGVLVGVTVLVGVCVGVTVLVNVGVLVRVGV